ncbi:hypothetical protein ACQPYA_08535 [Micromonospora sp. CA-263727]|uniref:hypothetical protein n=1 Tax=Micromonospora sp. CA-263727 TaxID=3239967 RepID=UPI003D8E87CB
MVDGPEAALAEVDALAQDARLAGYHYLPAIRADLPRQLDRPAETARAYQAALELADNNPERDFLTTRLTPSPHPLTASTRPPPIMELWCLTKTCKQRKSATTTP